MANELKTRRMNESRNTHGFTENDTKKYQIGKYQTMMDTGSRNSPTFMTDYHSK